MTRNLVIDADLNKSLPPSQPLTRSPDTDEREKSCYMRLHEPTFLLKGIVASLVTGSDDRDRRIEK